VNNEGIKCEQHFGYSSQADYVVATPSGHSQSGFGTRWCAYHEGLSSGGNNVAVTYFPYITDAGTSCGKDFVNSGSAGALDGVSIVGGHEMAETQTDPAPCSGWCDSSGSEIGDKCAWSSNSGDITLGGKVYAVQPLWSNAISGCPVV
jgi:serine protease